MLQRVNRTIQQNSRRFFSTVAIQDWSNRNIGEMQDVELRDFINEIRTEETKLIRVNLSDNQLGKLSTESLTEIFDAVPVSTHTNIIDLSYNEFHKLNPKTFGKLLHKLFGKNPQLSVKLYGNLLGNDALFLYELMRYRDQISIETDVQATLHCMYPPFQTGC